ncbi:MAG TPA: DUF5069 domain-containing protein [Nitrospiraceae bacterium]|nr:DUF5069 domain-containing protein [Nitrospiraceae bacterium]
MNLVETVPRSAKDKLLGLVSLKRTIDKAKAFNEEALGEYHYNCPHDKSLFTFLGVDAKTFAQKVKELGNDEAIAGWIQSTYLAKKTSLDIAVFNANRLRWHPEPGSDAESYFLQTRDHIAPGRTDIVTWFDLFDLDEKRPMAEPTKL